MRREQGSGIGSASNSTKKARLTYKKPATSRWLAPAQRTRRISRAPPPRSTERGVGATESHEERRGGVEIPPAIGAF